MTGFEPVTSSLPRKHSTTELHRLAESGRRASNSRPTAWKAVALPTELLPQVIDCFFALLGILLMCSAADPPKITDRLRKTCRASIIIMSWWLWGEKDSNLRSCKATDLQSAPFGRSGISPGMFWL